MDKMTFRSKVDWWFHAAIIVAAAACLFALVTVAMEGTTGEALALAPLFLFGLAFPVWLIRSTYYRFDDTQLYIRSGPFRWRVPYNDIRSIRPTRNPLSSPALSLDRLRLEYRKRAILISPADKAGFLAELKKRVPSLSQ